jgi:hypothetical protein
MSPNLRLRLESGDGFPVKEYRIEDGSVGVRVFDPKGPSDESDWRQLTSDELKTHVEHNTVVAQWLERRLGWRRLLQACVSEGPSVWKSSESENQQSL